MLASLKHEFGEILARGGDGVIYVGTERATGDKVAIKKRHCNNLLEVNEAMDEALMLSRMGTCEYIAHFRNVYLQELTIDGKQMFEVYIVTEYASGGDLFNVLSKVARNPAAVPDRSVEAATRHSRMPLGKWMRQICLAVAALQANNIAHRDLKLENIVLREDRSICLVDFGVSVLFSNNDSVLSGLAIASGSTIYCAPEQLRKKPKNTLTVASPGGNVAAQQSTLPPPSSTILTPISSSTTENSAKLSAFATDLWSLGVVLLEVASGHVFQLRRDKLVLGLAALEAIEQQQQRGEISTQQQWRDRISKFIVDMSPIVAEWSSLIVSLLSLRGNDRLGMLQQFLHAHLHSSNNVSSSSTSSPASSSSSVSHNSQRRRGLRRPSNAELQQQEEQMSVEMNDSRRTSSPGYDRLLVDSTSGSSKQQSNQLRNASSSSASSSAAAAVVKVGSWQNSPPPLPPLASSPSPSPSPSSSLSAATITTHQQQYETLPRVSSDEHQQNLLRRDSNSSNHSNSNSGFKKKKKSMSNRSNSETAIVAAAAAAAVVSSLRNSAEANNNNNASLTTTTTTTTPTTTLVRKNSPSNNNNGSRSPSIPRQALLEFVQQQSSIVGVNQQLDDDSASPLHSPATTSSTFTSTNKPRTTLSTSSNDTTNTTSATTTTTTKTKRIRTKKAKRASQVLEDSSHSSFDDAGDLSDIDEADEVGESDSSSSSEEPSTAPMTITMTTSQASINYVNDDAAGAEPSIVEDREDPESTTTTSPLLQSVAKLLPLRGQSSTSSDDDSDMN